MVTALKAPNRPLAAGGQTWTWQPSSGSGQGQWCRVYHAGTHNPDGHTPRTFGPLARFDPHRPDADGKPQHDPDGRAVLYVGVDLATSLCEVFGEAGEALLCPRWRVALLKPDQPLVLFDLCRPGAAMAIGALPALADGNEPRALTQQWARAIYEDQPASRNVTGIRYRSAYNGGFSLAVWDCAATAKTVAGQEGRAEDYPLTDEAMLRRVKAACSPRHITVNTVDPSGCHRCRSDP